jgi:hypothetical protein
MEAAMSDDPLLSAIDARIAAIKAAVPQDLTRITTNDPPLGFESLVAASMEGDPGPAEPPIDGGVPDNTATAAAPSTDTVRIIMHEMIDGQISADVIAIDVDKATRAVSLAVVPADLAQIGVAVGARCIAINGNAPYAFLEGGLPTGEVLQWDVALRKRTMRLQLIFKEESGAAEQVPSDDVPVSEADGYWSEDWNRFAQAAPSADIDEPWRDRGPAGLTEMAIPDHQRERVRPPRPMAVHWEGWGREPDVCMDYRPPPRPILKQRSPLYDRRR